MLRRVIQSLYSPRIVSGITVTSYTILLILGVDVLFALPDRPLIHWVPAIMMMIGALIGIPCAWIRGRKLARWELVFMPISIAGLLGGIVIEAHNIWTTSFAGHLLLYLGIIVLLIVILRWVYIRRTYNL